MRFSDRLGRLGTETAFAVATRANEHIQAGNKVYPFHLGDMNFKTPDFICEAANKAMNEGKTGYCPNAGITPLREALAKDLNSKRKTNYTYENVIIQPGGKPVIGKFILSCMNEGDEVLYPTPGYPIYESQIEFHGGVAVPYRYTACEDGFRIDLEGLEKSISPKTKLIIINDLQNPTGAVCTAEERSALAKIIVKHDLYVLLDEAYFETSYDEPAKSFVDEPGMLDRSVLLYTFSKKFAMTGWRLGAAAGPKELMGYFQRLNTNDESCPNHFAQYGALAGLTGDQTEINAITDILRERRDLGVRILNECNGVSCFSSKAGFYLFPDVTELMINKGFGDDYAAFAEDILVKTGVSLCTRLHFSREMPNEDRRFVRLSFSGIEISEMEEGLNKFKEYANN